MSGTFLSFQVAGRAMAASQASINVTGNNIANVNTKGYTRQRVDVVSVTNSGMVQKYATPPISSGLGARAERTTQLRDPFLDARYRSQTGDMKKFETMVYGLSNLENVIDEASTDGLQAELSSFIKDLQTFAQTPLSGDIAQVTRSAAQKVTQLMNLYSKQLQEVRKEQVQDLDVVVNSDFNNLVKNIGLLNEQIQKEEIYGAFPNELYDQRNVLIDDLSKIANIKVNVTPQKVTEDLSLNRLSISIDGMTVVDNDSYGQLSMKDEDGKVTLSLTDAKGKFTADIDSSLSSGSARAYLDIINGKGNFAKGNENTTRGVGYYAEAMDIMAEKFSTVLNDINSTNGISQPLFDTSDHSGKINAGNIKVSEEWLADPSYINNSTDLDKPGSANNIQKMIIALEGDQNFENPRGGTFFSGSFHEFNVGLLGDIGTDVDANVKYFKTSDNVLENIFDARQSVSGVNLNEEATNLMAFQKCYNACLRYFTVLDENIDAIISKMGLVGR